MKEIKAILQPGVLTRVLHALRELPHFPGVTVIDTVGQGRGRGEGGEFVPDPGNVFLERQKLLCVIASDEIASDIIATIRDQARTGHHGDGLIVVTEAIQTIRIRTGESENDAL
ncbi:MAG: P-II family nitrogen regulator [Chthoniobacterales bacterium]